MNSTDYIKAAIVTESVDFEAIRGQFTDRNIRLLHGAIGVATEGGELLDAIKKAIFYGRGLDVINFKEEVFDIMWYLAIICDALGTTFEEGMETNIAKLKARYGDKFSQQAALNRDLAAERLILEGKK